MKSVVVLLLSSAVSVAGAQKAFPTVEQQITTAVMALPDPMRANATVMGWKAQSGKLEVLRPGTNGMICLAQFAVEEDFHVSCYHEGIDPFMARGRQLREQGIRVPARVDSIRYAEVRDGKIKMPGQAALYQIFGNKDSWDAATGSLTNTRTVFVIYLPSASAATTGLPTTPQLNAPWLMNAGTPKAHIMFTPSMR